MFKCEIISGDGRILKLEDSSGITVYEIEGLNPVKAEINVTRSIGWNGGKFASSHVESRNLVIKMALLGNPEETRRTLYNFCSPSNHVKFHFIGDTKDVYIDGYVEDLNIAFFSMYQTAQLVILCPEPFWKDSMEQVIEMQNVTASFQFPYVPNEPVELGTYSNITEILAVNDGDVDTGLTIRVTASGQVVNPIIYNKLTNEFIGITYTLEAGNVLEITTGFGRKDITLYIGNEAFTLFSKRLSGSTWLSLRKGDNLFQYDADSGKEFMNVKLIYTPEYTGV